MTLKEPPFKPTLTKHEGDVAQLGHFLSKVQRDISPEL